MKSAILTPPTSFGAGAPLGRAAASRPIDVSIPRDDRRKGVSRRGKVRKQDVADMTAQLAIMTKSGVDLSSALSSLAVQSERPQLAAVLRDVNELVLSGNTLSEALRQHADVFDPAYIATIAAAEASGRMAEVLNQLAGMQRSEMRLRRSIVSLLSYPIMLVCISSAVIATLVVVVLPQFSTIFHQYNTPLPAITRLMLAVALELQTRWWLWIPVTAGAVCGAFMWRRTAHGRRTLDSLLLYGTVVRDVTRPLLIGRTCRMIGLLLQSGVPLLEALRLARQAIGNLVYKDLLEQVAESVMNGRGMEPPLADAEIVPTSAQEMMITAERTGNLADVADMLGSYFEEEAETRMRSVVRMLEPAITVVMGAVVAIVVMSVMLPIFDLSSFNGGH